MPRSIGTKPPGRNAKSRRPTSGCAVSAGGYFERFTTEPPPRGDFGNRRNAPGSPEEYLTAGKDKSMAFTLIDGTEPMAQL